jgi:beta-N-acetylhexosaminidase
MSPQASAGQLLVAGFDGLCAPRSLLERISQGRLAGVILFSRNIESPAQVLALTSQLQQAARDDLPLLIAIDQEGGRVQRIREPLAVWPPMARLGEIDDPSLTRAVGAAIGADLAALGFNVDFAPVLDVVQSDLNSVIADRAFGDTSELVTRHGLAFADGLKSAGVLSCGKHFPGHGGPVADSHVELPREARSRQQLEAVDLRPFVAASRACLPMMMIAHVVYDGLDAQNPATTSSLIVDGLLRKALAYEGVICSDDMEMGAIARHQSPPQAVLAGLRVGIDLFLMCHSEARQTEAEALLEAARSNDSDASRVEASIGRVRALRRELVGLKKAADLCSDALVSPPRHAELLAKLRG